uniref:Uncharacterized protein n=1 Tax=Kalanchoe fedtschenkoi TaxID=63787 RepID=A0A7N0U8Z4_KALFE
MLATPNILDDKAQQQGTLHVLKVDGLSASGGNMSTDNAGSEASGIKFTDTRWKKGTWDLNMFVKDGKMDWDSLILQSCPEASTNEEPVLFRSSIIPWSAGRAAMVGFFTAYLVDILTDVDMVGQTGSFLCKTGLLITVLGVILLRRTKDFENLKKVADEATFYDKQWQASWQDQEVKCVPRVKLLNVVGAMLMHTLNQSPWPSLATDE